MYTTMSLYWHRVAVVALTCAYTVIVWQRWQLPAPASYVRVAAMVYHNSHVYTQVGTR